MRELTLEKEFEIYKQLHKTSILTARISKYYKDLNESGVKIPEFLTVDPLKMAQKEVIQLLSTDINKFNTLYEEAWREYANVLP